MKNPATGMRIAGPNLKILLIYPMSRKIPEIKKRRPAMNKTKRHSPKHDTGYSPHIEAKRHFTDACSNCTSHLFHDFTKTFLKCSLKISPNTTFNLRISDWRIGSCFPGIA